jgi:hypothetical protein
VRRRAPRLDPVPGGLALRGRVHETLLFGDERQVVVDVPDAGRVTALMSAPASAGLAVDGDVLFHVPADQLVVVPDDAAPPDQGAPHA